MSKIKNEKVIVNEGLELNLEDILNDILSNEKNMSNNFSIALNEMSNKVLYDMVFDIFKCTKDLARSAYNLAFKNGWYVLETESESKINSAYKEYSDKLNYISLEGDE